MSSSVPVPKFLSFKPKVDDGDRGNSANLVRPSRGGLEGKERKHRHRRRPSRSRERTPRQLLEERLPVQTLSDDTSEHFVEDRKGDIQNLVYGSIHRYNIPAFHRTGAGSVLGTKTSLKIDRSFTEDKCIILQDRRDEKRGEREKYAFARNEKKALKLLRIRPLPGEDVAATSTLDFIALRSPRARNRRGLGSESSESSDEGKRHYRSIEGKAKAKAKDDDLVWISYSDSSDPERGRTINFDETLKRENARLSRRVDEHPEDVDAWISLIDHQDSLLGLADHGRRKVTTAERRSTADIKLHMYEKALTTAGSTLANRERLLLGLMTEGTKIWDFKRQSERWEQVSQDNLDSVLLWKQYLDFRQSTFVAFRFEEVRGVFLKRIKLLKEAIKKSQKAKTETGVLFEHFLYTILRVTLYFREAGFSELAIAIWQALLEFNFLGPTLLLPNGSRLDSFRDFWDSEVLRIGEAGANGWKNFNGDTDVPDPKADEETPRRYLETDEIFHGWVAAERMRSTAAKMPARTLDDTIEDDPYRVILWSDVEDYLIDISLSSNSNETGRLLLDAFLIFCSLPPVPSPNNHVSRQWWIDPFSRGEILDCNATWIQSHLMGKQTEERFSDAIPSALSEAERPIDCNRSEPFEWPIQFFVGSSDTLFGPRYWGRYMPSWRRIYGERQSVHSPGNEQHLDPDLSKTPDEIDGPVPFTWLQNCLKTLVEALRNESLTEYYLAFEFYNEPQGIKKLAKGLLKKNPQSLRLYNAYAMIERAQGNASISTNVITAALGMLPSLPPTEEQNAILLWRTWIWACIDDGDNHQALRCLCDIVDCVPSSTTEASVDALSPAALLKTKHHLSSNRDFCLTARDTSRATIFVECLALLEYLSSPSETLTISSAKKTQGDITSALAVIDAFSSALLARSGGSDATSHSSSSSSAALELLLQSATRLLYHHAHSGRRSGGTPFRPALLRDHLTTYLHLFPRNTLFLSLYMWNESRFRIDDRVRTLLRSTILVPANDNFVSRLFAIRHEMRTGNLHSTIAAFENALLGSGSGSAEGRACTAANPGLWRFYVLFCGALVVRREGHNNNNRSRAKDVFLRAMRACPWAKGLLMMAFSEVEPCFGTEEKLAVYRVMVEKELRVHVDLEARIEESRRSE